MWITNADVARGVPKGKLGAAGAGGGQGSENSPLGDFTLRHSKGGIGEFKATIQSMYVELRSEVISCLLRPRASKAVPAAL